jgi:hypothetical protein
MCEYWRFFRPDIGFGDARDANLQAQLNEELYRRGLVGYDWKMTGRNDIDGWAQWARHGLMTPIHNNGRTKHYMFGSLRNLIKNCLHYDGNTSAGDIMVLPMVDREKAAEHEHWRELQQLVRELENLVSEQLKSGYERIDRHKKKISDDKLEFSGSLKLGDDRPDALAMSNHGLTFKASRHAVTSGSGVAYVSGF